MTWIKNVTEGVPNNDDRFVRMPDTSVTIGTPWEMITGRFDKTASYAEDAFKITTTFVDNIAGLLTELDAKSFGEITIDETTIAPIDLSKRPNLPDISEQTLDWWQDGAIPKPILVSFPEVAPIDIPRLTTQPPVYEAPDKPIPSEISDPGSGPVLSEIALPPIPDYVLPQVPTIEEIFISPAPNITIPTFDAEFIEEDIPSPANFSWASSPFNSDIWNAILDKAIDGVVNGGTGVSAEVEQMIFDRAKERLRYAHARLYTEAETYYASRGYDSPPGALASRLTQIALEATKNDLDLIEKIAIDQANLAQKNTHFMLEYGRQAEVILRDFHNNQENRILEASKLMAAHSIALVNTYVARYNAKLEKYKTDASVYTEILKGALAELEIYKVTLEGTKIASELQQIKVDIYKSQLSAIEVIGKIYSTQLEGSKILADVEKLKIESFKVSVEIYTAKQQAEKIKSEIYGIEVEAEKNKSIAYSEVVKAHLADLEGKKIELDIQIAARETVAKENAFELERYKVDLGAYTSEIDAKAKQLGATVELYGANTQAYSAETTALGMYYDAQKGEIDSKIQVAKLNLDKILGEIDSATKSYIALKELEVKAADGVITVSSQLAASALSAVSANASYGYSGSESFGHSFNYGASIQESHSFTHPTDVSE